MSRNASKTKPAKFVDATSGASGALNVFFIKDEGAPILTPVHQFRTRAMYFPDETFCLKAIFLMWRHV